QLRVGGDQRACLDPARLVDLHGAEPVREFDLALAVGRLDAGARSLRIRVRRDVAELRDRSAHARDETWRARAYFEDFDLETGLPVVFRLHRPAPDDELLASARVPTPQLVEGHLGLDYCAVISREGAQHRCRERRVDCCFFGDWRLLFESEVYFSWIARS